VFAVPVEKHSPANALWSLLSPEERDRAERFLFDAPRWRFIVGRAALRTLLGRYLDMPATKIAVCDDANGKPQLAKPHEAAQLRFNIAHSGMLALVAVTRGCEIGVDVEQIRAVDHREEISRRFFHDEEVRAILSTALDERSTAFLRCWTAKEAVLKAVGVGLSVSLAGFQVPIGEHEGCWVHLNPAHVGPPGKVWLQPLMPHADYVAAVAVAAEKRDVRTFTRRC
jgi:4'-phosphopantetheinyl transferase